MFSKILEFILQKSYSIRHLKDIIRGKMFLKKLDKNKYYILCPFGIGDLCFSVNAMRIKYPDRNNIVYITRTAEKNLSTVFGNVEIIGNTELCKTLIRYVEITSKYIGDNYFYANFSRKRKPFLEWEYLYFKNKTNFWDDLCQYIYHIPVGSLENCYKKATGSSNIILSEKDIVLFPYANSTPLIPSDFWIELAAELKSKGYNVYTNIVKSDELIEGTAPLQVPLHEICAAVENSAGCIALRSGICDLLAMYSIAKMFVIHTDEFWLKYADTRYFRDFGIENFTYESKEEMIKKLSEIFKRMD